MLGTYASQWKETSTVHIISPLQFLPVDRTRAMPGTGNGWRVMNMMHRKHHP